MKKVLVGLFLVTMLSSCGFEIVDTGHRGVQTRFGKVVGESLEEGFHMYNPLTSNITEMDVRENKYESSTLAYTKDVQNVKVVFTVNYYPEKTQIHKIYENVGREWANKLMPQVVIGKIKEVVGQYQAVDLVSDRLNATTKIFESVRNALGKKGIVIKNFEINNLDFNDAFENAVEAKVVAIQQAEEAKNKTVRIKEEADQKVIAAKAEAESMRIRANALTQNKALVEYEAVQKWDGKMPQYMMGGTIPFINLAQ